MNKIAIVLVVVGVILIVGVMTMHGWDISKLSTEKYETNTYEITDAFTGICVETETANIVFLRAEGEKCTVVCCEEEKASHAVDVSGDTLSIRQKDERRWYDYIGFSFHTPKITVYLPAAEYDALYVRAVTGSASVPGALSFASADIAVTTGSIDFAASADGSVCLAATTGSLRAAGCAVGSLALSTSTGRVTVSDVSCTGDIELAVTTGKAALADVSCAGLISVGDTGGITLERVLAECISIQRTTGDVAFDGSDAAAISVQTSTGNVTGTLLSGKQFAAKTSTGEVHLPSGAQGGPCEITTATGNIDIAVAE